MDNEDELMPPKAFDFFEEVSNYNPKDSPSNGYEYLYQVVNEAAKTPKTLVADINTDRFKKNQTIYVEEKVSSESPQDFIPSEEWQKLQLRNFNKVKRDITQKRIIWDKKNDTEKAKYLPRDRQPDNWLKFCNVSLPLLRTILSISQPDLDLLLEYHVQWLEQGNIEFCQRTNIWLFSILACLEEPLLPNTCANLRCVIRAAKHKRSTLSGSHDELLLPLNILICIAAKFFRQSDLGD